MLKSVYSISLIRWADTDARGNIIEIIEIIKNDIIICIAYCINAIISPTCIVPKSTWWDPTHTIKSVSPFIISIITGIIDDINLLTNKFVLVKSLFALSNLTSSCFWVLKALITNIPVRCSLVTKFNLSTNFWTALNLGIANPNNTLTSNEIRITPTAIIQVIFVSVLNTFITPPMPNIGA